MKAILLFTVLSAVAFGLPVEETHNVDLENTIQLNTKETEGKYQNDTAVEGVIVPVASDLTYYFFSQKTSRGVAIKSNAISNLRKTDFDAGKETVFIIHGWTNSDTSSVNKKIRQALIAKHDVNVFVVDWSIISWKDYVSAASSVKKIGGWVADVIKAIQSQFGLSLDKLQIVGFSLGAHIAGNAGSDLNGKVARIVGLDPAGPMFTVRNTNNRLDPTDAKFVQVIHTNGGGLGFYTPSGHVDYYPNGGRVQAGCGTDLSGVSSHNRAFSLYAESITNNKFVSRECSSYSRYETGLCRTGKSSLMGGFMPDTSVTGTYYLDTNRVSPYGRG